MKKVIKRKAKTLIGKVVSNSMDKSISVLVQRTLKHSLFGKYIKRSTKLIAHDEHNGCMVGDVVVIAEGKPISKRKSWRLKEVVRKGRVV